MTPTACLQELSARGVRLWVEAAALKYRAPAGALTDDLRTAVAASKSEIVRLLDGRPELCPRCTGRIESVICADGRIAFGCFDSAGEHFHQRVSQEQQADAGRTSIVIPEPLPIDLVEKCFNGDCPALLEFKQGRAYCRRCDVHQRIVE